MIQMHSFVSFLPPLPSGGPFFADPGCFLAHRLVLGVPVLGCIPSVHCPLVPTTLATLHNLLLKDCLLHQWAQSPSDAQLNLCNCQTAEALPVRVQTVHAFVSTVP